MFTLEDKNELRESLDNNTNRGEFENEEFYIFSGWDFIEELTKTLQPYYNFDREFEKLLAFLSSDDSILFDSASEIEAYKTQLLELDYIAHGQLPLNGFPIVEELDNKQFIETMLTEWENLKNDYPNDSENDLILSLNEWVIDEYITPNKIEWGFSDEYTTCSECYNVIRTEPEFYGWRANFIVGDGFILCADCCENDKDSLFDDTLQKIENAILQGVDSLPSIPYPLRHMLDSTWIRIPHPYDNDRYESQWESGFHNGQNDNPTKQSKIVYDILQGKFWVVCNVTDIGQFDISWNIMIKQKSDDTTINLSPELLEQIGTSVFNGGKNKYDLGELFKQAMDKITLPYASITFSDDTVSVEQTDNLEEYFDNVKRKK